VKKVDGGLVSKALHRPDSDHHSPNPENDTRTRTYSNSICLNFVTIQLLAAKLNITSDYDSKVLIFSLMIIDALTSDNLKSEQFAMKQPTSRLQTGC
jgi:hypothetical protein